MCKMEKTLQRKVTLFKNEFLHSMTHRIACPVCQRVQKHDLPAKLPPREDDTQSQNFLNGYAYHELAIIS